MKRYVAEFIGTFILVFGGCGAAVFAAGLPGVGIGYHGVALAFGLTVVVSAYAFGSVSGCHLNPAVTVGLVVAGRHSSKDLPAYVVAQVLGAVVAAGALMFLLGTHTDGVDKSVNWLAANGYGDHSPNGYGMIGGLIAEIILTFVFLMVIIGATSKKAHPALAGLAIGLCLTLIHLISIPITNTSVNPARSTGPAIFMGGWAIKQLWLFWVAPIVGAALAGFAGKWLFDNGDDE